MDKLIKVELGCGKTKNEGYIGIDRFPLPGVDIVADLNDKIPMEDNSVDVLFACHSLEHFEDLSHIMEEIYRVCKPEAIIHILAPYYNTTTNLANHYHVQVFNEETFRFFCADEENHFIDKEDWYCPHAIAWGLSLSDNNNNQVNLVQIGVEYFYYKEYRDLSDEQKLHLRRSISNVCDQLLYTLIVVKGEYPSYERLQELKNQAKKLEPPIIEQLRQRDQQRENISSILTDIQQITIDKIRPYGEKLEQAIDQNKEILHNEIQQSNLLLKDTIDILMKRVVSLEDGQKELQQQVETLKEEQQDLQLQIKTLKAADNNLKEQILQNQIHQNQINHNFALSANILELSRIEKPRFKNNYMLWSHPESLYMAIKMVEPEFADGLISHTMAYKKSTRVCASIVIPQEGYLEYHVSGYGDSLKLFLFGALGTSILLETVVNGSICGQVVISLEYQGVYKVQHPMTKKVCIRLKQISDIGVVRTLELANRSHILFEKRILAAYLE